MPFYQLSPPSRAQGGPPENYLDRKGRSGRECCPDDPNRAVTQCSVRDAMFAGEMGAFLPHPTSSLASMTVKIDTESSLCFSTIAPVLQC